MFIRLFSVFFAVLSTVLLMFSAQEAGAVSLRYKFKVVSSGPRMYACNAGIIAQETNRRVCYFEGTKNECTPENCSTADKVCHSSCVCSSASGGDWLMNFGSVKWVGMSPTTGAGSKVFRGTSSTVYSTAFSDADSWGHRITDLDFNLGSELYTGKYFVDICYDGPQIEYFEKGVNTNFVLVQAQAYAYDALYAGKVPGENDRTGMTGGVGNYSSLAGLQVESYMTCDLQGVGTYIYARNDVGQTNTLTTEAGFVYGISQLPVNATEGSGSFHSSGTPMALVGTAAMTMFDRVITNNSTKAPRHCKVRYIFTETNWKDAAPNKRAWETAGAEMCTYTEIAEPPDSEMP